MQVSSQNTFLDRSAPNPTLQPEMVRAIRVHFLVDLIYRVILTNRQDDCLTTSMVKIGEKLEIISLNKKIFAKCYGNI